MPKPPPQSQISPRGRELLTRLEGRRLRAYEDVAGLSTIGVGHLLTKDELATGLINAGGEMKPWRAGISVADSNAILDRDIARFEAAINAGIQCPISQNQFDALACLAFNIGVGAFNKSTLRKRINAGLLGEVPEQFRRWNKAGGVVMRGLVDRREEEIKLWNGV